MVTRYMVKGSKDTWTKGQIKTALIVLRKMARDESLSERARRVCLGEIMRLDEAVEVKEDKNDTGS